MPCLCPTTQVSQQGYLTSSSDSPVIPPHVARPLEIRAHAAGWRATGIELSAAFIDSLITRSVVGQSSGPPLQHRQRSYTYSPYRVGSPETGSPRRAGAALVGPHPPRPISPLLGSGTEQCRPEVKSHAEQGMLLAVIDLQHVSRRFVPRDGSRIRTITYLLELEMQLQDAL